jgi:hypothetical protein
MYKTVIIFLNADPSLKSCHFSKLSTLCRVSSKQTNKSFRFEPKQTETFGSLFSVCFAKPITIIFGLFRCFGPVSKQPKQTDLFRNKQKKNKKIQK